MTSIQVEAAQPVKVSKMPSFSSPRQVRESTSDDETEMELPLPDVVLCSALSANILHGQRQRQRRRHKASIQTKGREHLEETPLEEMMEPLVQSLSELLGSTTISMNPDPAPDKEEEDHLQHLDRLQGEDQQLHRIEAVHSLLRGACLYQVEEGPSAHRHHRRHPGGRLQRHQGCVQERFQQLVRCAICAKTFSPTDDFLTFVQYLFQISEFQFSFGFSMISILFITIACKI